MRNNTRNLCGKTTALDYRGFSIVEVLLASTVFALLATALIGAVIYGRESMATAGARGRALLIAEEGLEAGRNIRDSNFADLTDGNYGLSLFGNQWLFSGTSDVVFPFTRQVAISTPSADRKQVVSTVTWQQTPSRTGTVTLATYHTNWRVATGSGGGTACSVYCTPLGYSAGTCRGSAGACADNGETYEAGGDSQCTGGPSQDTCCCAP